MVRIRRITTRDPLYRQECALREDVLLRPLGIDLERFGREFPGVEDRLEHFVATFEHEGRERVIGCAALLANDPVSGSGRLMQMAVDPQRQGEGIGRRLVVAVEARAFGELGLRELACHAQTGAIGFYERIGWHPDSEVFLEAGIPHQRVAMRYAASEEEPA